MRFELAAHVESCESTQALVDPAGAEGTYALADFQTAGRGRLGRTWEAPPGSALLLSVLLKPPPWAPQAPRSTGRASPALPATHAAPARALPQLALVAGVAVADALEHLTDLSVQIKWPNDVMLRRQKVCGILAEVRDGAVVLGIGVNLTQGPAELPERAGSLLTTTGQEYARDDVLAVVLDALGARYETWLAGGLDAVYDGLGPRDFLRGRMVSVNGTTGVAQLIDREGRLLIASGHGDSVAVESGEVVYER